VKIPEPNETEDNIVAFWVPDHTPSPQKPHDFEYRVLWQMDRTTRPPQSWAAQTRRGRGGYEGYVRPDNSIQFVIDFEGPELRELPPHTQVDAAMWIDSNGSLLEQNVFYDEVTGGQRMIVRFRRVDDSKPVEIHASIRKGSETVSETWSYILPPD
jgi:glucans biosynthesis protein